MRKHSPILSSAVLLGVAVSSFVFAAGPAAKHKGIFNLGVRIFNPQVNGNAIVVPVDEIEDLNGDGDARDVVLHSQVYGPAPLTNLHVLGEAVTPAYAGFLLANRYYLRGKRYRKARDLGFHALRPVAGTGIVGFERSETGIDWNGDGDTSDWVAQVMDPDGSVRNLGIAPWNHYPLKAGEEILTFVARESENWDFNGDGDRWDLAVVVWDDRTETMDLFTVGQGAILLSTAGRLVAWSSGSAGTNLWDADLREIVVHFPVAAMRVGVAGRQAAFSLSESYLGDRNGDGDDLDFIAFLYDADSETLFETNLGVNQYFFPIPSLGEREVFMPVDEHFSTDANGDGDFGDQSVLHVFDTVTGAITNLGLAGEVLAVRDDAVVLAVSEHGQGQTDLNGDGDVADSVLFLYDRSTGEVANLLADVPYWGPVANLRSGVVMAIREGGRHDFNRDGDRDDDVLHVLTTSDSRLTSLDLAVDYWSRWAADGNTMVVSVPESAQGGTDLDGDGKATDHIAFRIDLNRKWTPSRRK
jgi:hypothetical protein